MALAMQEVVRAHLRGFGKWISTALVCDLGFNGFRASLYPIIFLLLESTCREMGAFLLSEFEV
jgi:hypothetical protein